MGTICVIGAGKWGQALHFALNQQQKCFITSRTIKDIDNFILVGGGIGSAALIFLAKKLSEKNKKTNYEHTFRTLAYLVDNRHCPIYY